jgi:hypothetical protein
MNKKQIELAARLYILANTACLNLGGCDTDEEMMVVKRAIERCRSKLDRIDYDIGELGTLQKCIEAAKRDA